MVHWHLFSNKFEKIQSTELIKLLYQSHTRGHTFGKCCRSFVFLFPLHLALSFLKNDPTSYSIYLAFRSSFYSLLLSLIWLFRKLKQASFKVTIVFSSRTLPYLHIFTPFNILLLQHYVVPCLGSWPKSGKKRNMKLDNNDTDKTILIKYDILEIIVVSHWYTLLWLRYSNWTMICNCLYENIVYDVHKFKIHNKIPITQYLSWIAHCAVALDVLQKELPYHAAEYLHKGNS